MRRGTRNIGPVMTVLLTLTVFLAACGGSTSSGGSTTFPTPTIPSNVMGDFVGQVSGLNADISLSSNGYRLTAYTTNGTPTSITFALWFQGSITNNAVNLMAAFGAGAHLMASLTNQAATGTLTLKNGNPLHFRAKNVTDPPIQPGLYRGVQVVGGVFYLAGWVVLPSMAMTPTQTLTPSPTPLSQSQMQRGGIINQQTGALKLAPALTPQDIAAMLVAVPGLGMFQLTLVRLGEPGLPE
jgi:hypothetical protein